MQRPEIRGGERRPVARDPAMQPSAPIAPPRAACPPPTTGDQVEHRRCRGQVWKPVRRPDPRGQAPVGDPGHRFAAEAPAARTSRRWSPTRGPRAFEPRPGHAASTQGMSATDQDRFGVLSIDTAGPDSVKTSAPSAAAAAARAGEGSEHAERRNRKRQGDPEVERTTSDGSSRIARVTGIRN